MLRLSFVGSTDEKSNRFLEDLTVLYELSYLISV
jgi:hypothetical protein